MHTCPPPAVALGKWLEDYPTVEGNYGHLLLEQRENSDPNLAGLLVPYFESAHRDARRYFCEQIGINLHPDAEATDDGEVDGAESLYPRCLPVGRTGQ